MADFVADLPTSTTLTTMTEAGASFLTKQYQVEQRLHSQCHELCNQHGVLMLATQPNITQTECCDINSLTPAELNAVLACPVGGLKAKPRRPMTILFSYDSYCGTVHTVRFDYLYYGASWSVKRKP